MRSQKNRFTTSSTDEPHLRRRRTILQAHPEVRALMGYDRRTIWVTVGVVIAQLALAYGVSLLSGPVQAVAVVVGALLVGSILSHWCGMSIHETSHNLGARTRLGNRATAWLANVPMVLPMAETFHRYHLEHHAYLGVEGDDADLPIALELRWIGNHRARKAVWLLLYAAVYLARGATYARKISRGEVANIVAVMACNVAWYALFGWAGLAYLALSTIVGHSFHPVAAHFLHEHYVFEEGQETYSYYGPLNWVTFNVGYHYEHHDVMNIPGWSLPKYRRMTAEFYDNLVSHRSWTWVLWHFVTSKEMGPHSRIVRSRETHDRARRRESRGAPLAAHRDAAPQAQFA